MANDNSKRYWVRLVRPVFEKTTVEVAAASEEDAVTKALEAVATIPDTSWAGTFEADNYGIDATEVVADSDLSAGESGEDVLARGDEDIRYLPLVADINSGEGMLQMQPWLLECNALMFADVLGDWKRQIEKVDTEGSENLSDWLEDLRKRLGPQLPDNVASFMSYWWRKRLGGD